MIPKFRPFFLLLSFAFLCLTAQAQPVRFVQITDPHLFDSGDQGEKNRAALMACIAALNRRMDEKADYQFAAVTGDIGIENLVSYIVDPETKKRELEDPTTQERQLEEGAAQLASILAPTKINRWLFVPGNNDLYTELPDLKYYQKFLEKLRSKLPGLQIRDLCETNRETEPAGNLTLIGFNNASFKNDNDPVRLQDPNIEKTQRGYVERVINHLQGEDVRALVFYHIPEVDDPHIVLNGDRKTVEKRKRDKSPYQDSSWYVRDEIYHQWKENVVKNPKVLGLFAGHLHDWRRETYSGSLSKLYICPPLAIKLQDKSPWQARGFQEVEVDVTGRISRTIFWFDAANNTFDTDPTRRSNELELAVFYESEQRWVEAENYYREAAAKAETSAIREVALAGLKRVKSPNHSWVKSMLAWTDPLFLAPFVLRPLAVLLFVLIVGIMALAVHEGSSAMVISQFEGDEEMSKRLTTGFPAVKAKVKKLLDSPNQIFVPQGVQNAFPFVSPRLNEFFPQDTFEVAGVRIPNLNVLVNWIVRPRARVEGGAVSRGTYTFVYAEIWRRRLWFGSRLAVIVAREIPIGTRNQEEFENFIYDVYLQSHVA